MFRVLFLFIFCSAFLDANSQQLMYKAYRWESEPKLHAIAADEKEDNFIVLKDKMLYDLVYEGENNLVLYETRHVIIHFNNEQGIEEMNKVYIPYTNVLQDVDIKARTITSQGKVIPLNKSAIKKVDDLEDKGPFVIFAMEGVDKGSEIEYMYTFKKNFRTNSVVYTQTDKMRKNVSVDIYSPTNLVYEAKGYNGFPQFEKDTLIKAKNHIFASIEKIPSLQDEKYSATDAEKMRFEYQLVYNTAGSKSRLYSWEYTGNNIYTNLFTFEKAELKATDKLLEKLGLAKLPSDEKKIQALELHMKSNFNYKEIDEYIPVDKFLELKYGNDGSFQRFYIAAAKQLNIPVEAVVTTNRFDRKFDPSFQTQNSLQEYLLYFPGMSKYMSPNNYMSRLGYPPPGFLGNKGLFVKETQVGDIKTGISKVKTIDVIPAKNSYNNMTASVTFDESSLIPTVKMKMELMGYSAYGTQPNIVYMEDDKKKEFQEDMAKISGVETIVKAVTMEGVKNSDVMVSPLVISSVVETPQLIENAGNKFIFKLGELIGQQEEMYTDKERKTDVEIFFPQSYTRTFEIKLPAGYKFKSLDNINIDKRYTSNGKDLASFISTYKLDGDVLKINVYEDYQVLNFPKSRFEEYRKVVNASADFNKVIIILEKL